MLGQVIVRTQSTVSCAGSSIDSALRKKEFYYNKTPVAQAQLSKFPSTNSSNRIQQYLNVYLTTIRKSTDSKQVREIDYVQPPTQKLLNNLLNVLNCPDIEWQREREYRLSLPNGGVVSGKADHALCYGDFSICTVEDKSLKMQLTDQGICQALSQMRAAIENLLTLDIPYIPKKFVGILQNGSDWCFLFYHPSRRNWKTASAYLTSDTTTIAAFLEDALMTVKNIMDDLLTPRIGTEKSLKSIEEYDEDDEHDFEDDDNADRSDNFGMSRLQATLPQTTNTSVLRSMGSSKTGSKDIKGAAKSKRIAFHCENTSNYLNAEALQSQGVRPYKFL